MVSQEKCLDDTKMKQKFYTTVKLQCPMFKPSQNTTVYTIQSLSQGIIDVLLTFQLEISTNLNLDVS